MAVVWKQRGLAAWKRWGWEQTTIEEQSPEIANKIWRHYDTYSTTSFQKLYLNIIEESIIGPPLRVPQKGFQKNILVATLIIGVSGGAKNLLKISIPKSLAL